MGSQKSDSFIQAMLEETYAANGADILELKNKEKDTVSRMQGEIFELLNANKVPFAEINYVHSYSVFQFVLDGQLYSVPSGWGPFKEVCDQQFVRIDDENDPDLFLKVFEATLGGIRECLVFSLDNKTTVIAFLNQNQLALSKIIKGMAEVSSSGEEEKLAA